MDGKDVIKVPIISVDLERFDAISVVLLFYYLTLYKFFSALFYQFYLVLQYIEENSSNGIYKILYPSAFNYIMFYHYINQSNDVSLNRKVVIMSGIALVAIPFWSVMYLAYIGIEQLIKEGVNLHSTFYLLILTLIVPIIKWLIEHIKAIKIEFKKAKA